MAQHRERRHYDEVPGATAVQDSWPGLTCYGCGPSNDEGLRLKSYLTADGDALVATFEPRRAFNAGVADAMYGGLVASLVDCNSIWAAMTFRNIADGRARDAVPGTAYVTGRLSVEYLRPTPLDRPIVVRSWVEGEAGKTARVLTELGPAGQVTARGEVVAVAIDAAVPGEEGAAGREYDDVETSPGRRAM
ncbi:PaaI family thioesterase [Halobacteriaceae archaeon GCM10025711]